MKNKKVKIRKGCFETNSSSTHSICVAKNVNDINLPKEIVFVEGEFGWRYDVLKSTNEKANYLFTAIAYNEDYNALKSVVDILKKKGIKCNFLNSNYEEYDYFNENGELKDEKDINFNLIDGYVDHGTELKEFLNDICYDEDKLLSFLFSPLSFIITGNDNDGSNEYCEINVDYEYDEYFKGN